MRLCQTKQQLLITGNRFIDMFRHSLVYHVNNSLPRFSSDKILRIDFERRIYDYQTNEYIVNDDIDLIIYRPNNYTAVFSREHPSVPFYQTPPIHQDLLLWCYHDSCWTSDGLDRFLKAYESRITGLGLCGIRTKEINPDTQKKLQEYLRGDRAQNVERCRIIDEMMKNA